MAGARKRDRPVPQVTGAVGERPHSALAGHRRTGSETGLPITDAPKVSDSYSSECIPGHEVFSERVEWNPW